MIESAVFVTRRKIFDTKCTVVLLKIALFVTRNFAQNDRNCSTTKRYVTKLWIIRLFLCQNHPNLTTSDFLLCNNCGGDTDGYKRGYKDGGSGGDNSNGSSDDSIVVKS